MAKICIQAFEGIWFGYRERWRHGCLSSFDLRLVELSRRFVFANKLSVRTVLEEYFKVVNAWSMPLFNVLCHILSDYILRNYNLSHD
jgi:hypothetical protein